MRQFVNLLRTGNANLANLAVIAQASQGLLSAAEKTIKDKIDAQFSPLMEQADYWAKVASVRNNDLTEKERFQLTELSSKKKTEIASLQDTVQTIQNALLKNKAPASTYDAVDRVVAQWQSGQITAREAQTRLYQAASAAGLGSSAPALTLTAEDLRTLVGSGFSPQEVNQLKNDVANFGIDEVLAAQTDPKQKQAIEKIFNIQPKITRAQIESETTPKIAYDELKKTYTDEELKKVAIENGFASFWKSRTAEVEDFLNSDKARTLYIDLLYQQYKDAGMAE
jgi:mevalonate kinase